MSDAYDRDLFEILYAFTGGTALAAGWSFLSPWAAVFIASSSGLFVAILKLVKGEE